VSRRNLATLELPIPPLLEQHRIVAAIEEQFSRLDAGVSALERVRANLKRYRTAVLKAAVEGRLTEAWREENPNVEPASELLERILKERREQWEKNQLAAYEKKGKKPPKNWQSKYREPADPNTEELPELPQGWCWTSVEQLTSLLRNGLSQKPADTPPGYRTLRISAVRPMRVDMSDIRFLDLPEEKVHSFVLEEDDLLFTRYNGSINLLGVAGRVPPHSSPTLHPDKLIRVKATRNGVKPAYLEISSNAGVSREHIRRKARTTAGQTGVSGADIRQMPVPLPPLVEQEQIVAEVERRLSILQEVEAEVEANLKRAARLRQSILKRAFEGKLVPQDPADEPASELLARIKAQRERNAPIKRRKRGRAREEPTEAQAGLF